MTLRVWQNLALALPLCSGPLAMAETSVSDATVTIRKGDDFDFTIVSGSDEIAGEPAVADKEARESWKTACTQWKTELRELNKGNQLIALSCGTPKAGDGLNAATIYTSAATYKVRVRVRVEGKAK